MLNRHNHRCLCFLQTNTKTHTHTLGHFGFIHIGFHQSGRRHCAATFYDIQIREAGICPQKWKHSLWLVLPAEHHPAAGKCQSRKIKVLKQEERSSHAHLSSRTCACTGVRDAASSPAVLCCVAMGIPLGLSEPQAPPLCSVRTNSTKGRFTLRRNKECTVTGPSGLHQWARLHSFRHGRSLDNG